MCLARHLMVKFIFEVQWCCVFIGKLFSVHRYLQQDVKYDIRKQQDNRVTNLFKKVEGVIGDNVIILYYCCLQALSSLYIYIMLNSQLIIVYQSFNSTLPKEKYHSAWKQ